MLFKMCSSCIILKLNISLTLCLSGSQYYTFDNYGSKTLFSLTIYSCLSYFEAFDSSYMLLIIIVKWKTDPIIISW